MSRKFGTLVLFALASPLMAQWTVKTRKVGEGSKDGHIAFTCDLPVLTGEFNPKVRQVINRQIGVATDVDALSRQAGEMARHHEQVLRLRKRQPKPGAEEGGEDSDDFSDEHQITFEVGLNDRRLFSLGLNGYWHGGGGAVGNPYFKGLTFDAATGAPLSLERLVQPGGESRLRKRLEELMSVNAGDYFDKWREVVAKEAFDWFLTAKALVVRWPKYSVAPGFAGVVSVEVPWSLLKPCIDPKGPAGYLVK